MKKIVMLIFATFLISLSIIILASQVKIGFDSYEANEKLINSNKNAPGFFDDFNYDWPRKSEKDSQNGLWRKIERKWNDGLVTKNVFTINGSLHQLCLQVKKNGEGAQIDSVLSNYHYGLYKAKIKASESTRNIFTNRGVCNGFFVYWGKNDYYFEEIDVEILSKKTRHVYFTVHRGKDLFNPPLPENWSESSGPIRVKGKRTDKDFHEYGFKWLKDRVEFFIDDFSEPVWTYYESDDLSAQHIPSNPATLILNNWTGEMGWSGLNPKKLRKMYVDWVEYTPEIQADGAIYGFNEGSGNRFYDKNNGGNNGTIYNQASWVYSPIKDNYGSSGTAIEYDGINDYSRLENQPFNNAPFTIMFWAKKLGSGGGSTWIQLVRANSPGSSGGYCTYWFDDNSIQSVVCTTNGNKWLVYRGGKVNQWTHIALSYDFSKVKLYIDGKLEEEIVHSGNLNTPNWPFSIGGQGGGSDDAYFNGIIDGLKIFKSALSSGEINSIYLRERPN